MNLVFTLIVDGSEWPCPDHNIDWSRYVYKNFSGQKFGNYYLKYR